MSERARSNLVFWDNLDSSERATYLHSAANCAGQQDPAYFWKMHDYIFRQQRTIVSLDNDQLTQTAVNFGVDQEAYEACLANGEGLANVEALEAISVDRNIRGRPVFDINGILLFGSQPYPAFSAAIDQALEEAQ